MKITKPYTLKADVMTWCPSCFARLDATSCMTGEVKPQPGDFTICAYCGQILRFTPQMDLEKAELLDIPTHSRMLFAQMVQAIKREPMAHPIHKT